MLAWSFNLVVLIGCMAFLVFADTVVLGAAMADAERDGFVRGVLQSFAISLVLSFAVSDICFSLAVSLIPLRSKHSRHPVNGILSLISQFCD